MPCLNLLNMHIHVKHDMLLKLLFRCIFLAEITICENNVQSLLSAANLLMMQAVRDACSSFFERFLDETNAIGINCFAELHGTQELTKKAKRFVLKKFSQVGRAEFLIFLSVSIRSIFKVVQQDEWLHISAQKVIEFISKNALFRSRINVVFWQRKTICV